jgi:hypothetical protein
MMADVAAAAIKTRVVRRYLIDPSSLAGESELWRSGWGSALSKQDRHGLSKEISKGAGVDQAILAQCGAQISMLFVGTVIPLGPVSRIYRTHHMLAKVQAPLIVSKGKSCSAICEFPPSS